VIPYRTDNLHIVPNRLAKNISNASSHAAFALERGIFAWPLHCAMK